MGSSVTSIHCEDTDTASSVTQLTPPRCVGPLPYTQLVQTVIDPDHFKQFFVAAMLAESTVELHENLVVRANRRQPMRDDISNR